jgi:hypothetical protein
MTDRLIRIKQYEQAADDKVSFGAIKWLPKWDVCIQCDSAEEAESLRARLAQPEQEPVAWRVIDGEGRINYVSRHKDSAESWLQYDATRRLEPLYVAPPQREWVGLPESAFAAMTLQQVSAMKYAELLLKEKNNG